jgi:hypothetical protein
VPDQAQTDHIKPKMAVHIKSPFNPMSVMTKDKILEVFNTEPDLVVPCEEPTMCHINSEDEIFKNELPFVPKYVCIKQVCCSVRDLATGNSTFGLTPESLQSKLSTENILREQSNDSKYLHKIITEIENGKIIGNYFLHKNILCKRFNSPRTHCIVIPSTLVPFVLALYHYKTHAGVKKLLSTIRLKYYWKNMGQDVKAFVKDVCCVISISRVF